MTNTKQKTMKKTRIAYYITVSWRPGSVLHEQYIMANELHLIATFYKNFPRATCITVERHELDADGYPFC